MPKDLCKDVYVSYIFKHEPEVVHRVPVSNGRQQTHKFNYKKVHHIDVVTDYLLEYFRDGHVSGG